MIISTHLPGGDTDEGFDDVSVGEGEIEHRSVTFDVKQHGTRLDVALGACCPELSRSYIQQLIATDAVLLNGSAISKAASRVQAGDVATVEIRPLPQSLAFTPESMPLNIVYEDEDILVINKPAGLVVHPAPGNWSGTLLNGLLAYSTHARELPRAGIVHRLDKDTSGLMVVARSRAVMDKLVGQIAAREVTRQYLALAHRPWELGPRKLVEQPIGRDPRNRLRMAVVDLERHSGKLAATVFEPLDSVTAGCLLRCTLQTGRTHQIRVHASAIGHPLVADAVYGGKVAAGMERQALHASRLAFSHPLTTESMEFVAGLPPDMEQALTAWGIHYN